MPKYVADAVQPVPAFSFTEAEEKRLIGLLTPANGKRDRIIAQLVECARSYFWRRNQSQQQPTRAEQNAVLKELGDFARTNADELRKLEMRLRSLDLCTELELDSGLSACRLPRLTDGIADLADWAWALQRAAEQALAAGKQKSGPRMRMHVQRAVLELANLYEKFTGKPFSHNPKRLSEYDGKPHSPAGDFIVAFFEIVDPKVTKTSLSTAMARIVSQRNSAQTVESFPPIARGRII
jgi:hypothetical protein